MPAPRHTLPPTHPDSMTHTKTPQALPPRSRSRSPSSRRPRPPLPHCLQLRTKPPAPLPPPPPGRSWPGPVATAGRVGRPRALTSARRGLSRLFQGRRPAAVSPPGSACPRGAWGCASSVAAVSGPRSARGRLPSFLSPLAVGGSVRGHRRGAASFTAAPGRKRASPRPRAPSPPPPSAR